MGQSDVNPLGVRIRNARELDRTELVEISTRTIRASYTSFLGPDAVEGWLASGEVANYFERSLPDCVVMERRNEIVGFSVAKDELVDLMMIDCECHREGLGSALLRHVETELFKSYPLLRLNSFAGNKPANAFYVSKGWKAGAMFYDPDTSIPMFPFSKGRDA